MKNKYKICRKCWRQWEDHRSGIMIGEEDICPACSKRIVRKYTDLFWKKILFRSKQIEDRLLYEIFGDKKK